MAKLTVKQVKFCEYYAACGNATGAAIKAGYSLKTARSVGCENLTKPYIAKYIKELGIKGKQARIMSAEERQEMLSNLARNGELTPVDRIKAIDTLNKMTGEYVTKTELTGAEGGPLVMQWADDEKCQ